MTFGPFKQVRPGSSTSPLAALAVLQHAVALWRGTRGSGFFFFFFSPFLDPVPPPPPLTVCLASVLLQSSSVPVYEVDTPRKSCYLGRYPAGEGSRQCCDITARWIRWVYKIKFAQTVSRGIIDFLSLFVSKSTLFSRSLKKPEDTDLNQSSLINSM
ncbi:hypothetical protein LX36DRAFT_218267 [Colletotrichum falcatum]|nr:hypothetical protein LX36DRAFT_218267 [Colletotrichum falcatum]